MYTPVPSGGGCRAGVLLVAVASALFLHSAGAAQGCTPAAGPPAGPLCGVDTTVVVNGDSVTVSVFAGIPYAVPTTDSGNAGRWLPPTPFPAWTAPRQATVASEICPQLLYNTAKADSIGGDEDCLYLNVWQPPAASDSSTLPVMVFIHGGTFIAGAGSLGSYDGAWLAAAGNVVVVTINYRLGALGWLAMETDSATIGPNLGLQDQQLALQWVQANIGAFGGDSTQVTIFGESAGAMSVGLHLFAVPGSAPLFRAAIMESNLMAYPYRTPAQAQTDGAMFMESLCQYSGSRSCPGTMSWLQGLSTEDILQADSAYQEATMHERLEHGGLPELIPWSPVVDGTFVTGQPSAGYAAGMPPKPYVFGMNLNEGVLFAYLVEEALDDFWLARFYKTLVAYLYGETSVDAITRLKTSSGFTPYSNVHDTDSTTQYLDRSATALSNILNDGLFHCGNLASADSAQADSRLPVPVPVFGYLFAQPPVFDHPPTVPAVLACLPEEGFVCHTYELPYVFNNLAWWAGQPNSLQPTAADSTLAQQMSAAWASFATNPFQAPASGWQEYTANGELYVWGGSSSGTMLPGWSTARNCPTLWYGLPPLGS